MIADITTDVLGGRTFAEEQEVSFRCPDGWREHAKTEFYQWLLTRAARDGSWTCHALRCWALRRHPVRYTLHKSVVHFRQDILYPLADELVPPDRFGHPVIFEHCWLEGDGILDAGKPRFATEGEVISAFHEWLSRYRYDPAAAPPSGDGLVRLLRSWGVNPAQFAVRSAVGLGETRKDPDDR
jgi:hypothetical protein